MTNRAEWPSIRCVSVTWSYLASTIRRGKRSGFGPVLFGTGLALSMATSNGPPVSAPPGAIAPRPAIWSYPAAPDLQRTPFVGVIGDSTGSQLLLPLAVRLNPRGVGVVSATVGGCQAIDADLTFASPEYHERHKTCPEDARRLQTEMTARFHPKVVIWSDSLDWSDLKVHGQIVPAGGDRWRQLILDAWDRTLGRLGAAAVVLILPTWWADLPATASASFSVDRQRALFRAWAARHPGRVIPIDLGPAVCPGGPPCHQVMNGVRLRSDYLHYSPEGINRVISAIMAGSAPLANMRGLVALPVPSK
jgi:hypothetical protein